MLHKKNNAVTNHNSFIKSVLIGAAIGAIFIALFLWNVKNTNPAWGTFWMIRPFVVVPLAGACGGAIYYFMYRFRIRGGWWKNTANVLSIIIYLIGLWMGTILGLSGTLWN